MVSTQIGQLFKLSPLIAPSHLRERFRKNFIKMLTEAFDNDELKWKGEEYDEVSVKELNRTFNEVKEIDWVASHRRVNYGMALLQKGWSKFMNTSVGTCIG